MASGYLVVAIFANPLTEQTERREARAKSQSFGDCLDAIQSAKKAKPLPGGFTLDEIFVN